MTPAPLLEAHGIDKRFGGVHAVRDVSIRVGVGEAVGLVGANGAGKSTLIRVLAGAIQPDAGSLSIDGAPLRLSSPRKAQEAGISVIHQEPQLIDTQTVAENVFLGRPRPRRAGLIDWPALRRCASDVFERVGIDIDVTKPVGEASVWERWATTLAHALNARTRVLILDEPTAALDEDGVRKLFAAVRATQAEGAGIVFVSHRLGEVLELCDRVQVMRDGRTVDERPIDRLTHADLVQLITDQPAPEAARDAGHSTGRLRERIATAGVAALPSTVRRDRPSAPSERAALEVADLELQGRLSGVSFEVHAGEIVGLAGLVGSGRSSILRTLAGAEPSATGDVTVDGRSLRLGSTPSARRLGIAFLPEERIREGIVDSFSLAANVALGRRAESGRGPTLINHRAEHRRAQAWIDAFTIRGGQPGGGLLSLSGGNQQKALFARMLERRPGVLLLDEPTRGVDIGSRREIADVVRRLAAEGMAVVVAMSDLDELTELVDSAVVLREGALVARMDAGAVSTAAILEACYEHH